MKMIDGQTYLAKCLNNIQLAYVYRMRSKYQENRRRNEAGNTQLMMMIKRKACVRTGNKYTIII